MKHTLTHADAKKMRMANAYLTEITRKHHSDCNCDWCIARVNTDIQDVSSWTQEYLSYGEAESN